MGLMGASELDVYAVTDGGPLCRTEERLRIMRDDPRGVARLVAIVVAVAWVPMLVAGTRWRIVTGDWPIALREIVNHVRPLVMLPLLFAAEALIDERARGAGRYLVRSRIVGDACLARHQSVITRTMRLRDSSLVEAALFTLSVVSVFTLPSFTRESEHVIMWSTYPGVLLYRFLALRLLWRWGLWAFYLLQLSRLPLNLRPTHPDRLAGLAPLTEVSVAFGLAVMTGAAAAAAAWGDRMRFEHVPAAAFSSVAVAYVIVSLLVAGAPLWAFTALLIRTRHEGQRAYGALANRYSDAFERRWLDQSGEDALGSSDFQALNDLGGSFERVQQIRPILATRAMVGAVVAGALIPMLPLFVAEVGAATLLQRLAKALL